VLVCGWAVFAYVAGLGDYAVGDFVCCAVENCSSTAYASDDVYAHFAAVIHVQFVLWVLVFADADCAGVPSVKPKRVWDAVGFACC